MPAFLGGIAADYIGNMRYIILIPLEMPAFLGGIAAMGPGTHIWLPGTA